MSVPSDLAGNRYVCTGSSSVFPYTFTIDRPNDILVLLNGNPLLLGTHYSVSGVGNSAGGNVTLVLTPNLHDTITILRAQPMSQLTDYVSNEAYNPPKVLNDLDKIQMVSQMLAEELARSPKFARHSVYTNKTFPDPAPSNFIAWNGGGLDLVNVDPAKVAGMPPLVVFPVGTGYGGTGSATRSVHVGAFGASPSATFATNNAAIQAAINAIQAVGGGYVDFDQGVYQYSAALPINWHGVKFRGTGTGEVREAAPQIHTTGTCLKWAGAVGGTMLTMGPVESLSNYRLVGCGIEGIFFDGNNVANVGLDLKSLNECTFKQLAFFGCRVAAIKTGVVTTLAIPHDFQHNRFSEIWIEAANGGTSNSSGIILDGDISPADTSCNIFTGLHILYKDGVGIDIKNADANVFINTHCICYGAGRAVVFRASASSVYATGRNNFFFYLEAHTGGVLAESNAFPSTDNVIYGYTLSNGAPVPTIQAGASLWYETESFSSRIRKQTHSASVRISASQSIPDATPTLIAFNAEVYDTSALHDNVTNNTVILAPQDNGKYLITISGQWDVSATGQRVIQAFVNGVGSELVLDVRAGNATISAQSASGVITANRLDTIEMKATQNSGGPLNLTNATMTLTYLGE